ncbi:hypothetical protein D9611_003957 [Ephemerocybe angulata]|uniref:Uncharacterized protein n=1 Tax=Ephemerocybe angulata TaxID=980116 RepID=A0A8H5B5F1_9AGAR|nr:hypothetical protein D9611_003957 [Tulosesus angulatus]
MSWIPSRSLQETEALLCAPGSIHETQTALVDGRLYKVYKNLWPSLREFWLAALAQYAQDTYIVYEDRRLTYSEVHSQALRVADLMRSAYNIQKGDRVGICSRNCPEYLVVFWACHLIGAVAVLANAWLPVDPLRHCLSYTDCKLIFVDSERAEVLASLVPSSTPSSSNVPSLPAHFVLIDASTSRWHNITPLDKALQPYMHPVDIEVLRCQLPIYPEDNATIIFTSGTTGLPKGVLSTQRQFLTNVLNVLVGGFRAALRRGEDFPPSPASASPHQPSTTPTPAILQKAALVAVPLFHVTGSTSYSMMATLTGMKIVLMRKWIPEDAVTLIKRENVAVAGGVPSMVSDLVESTLAGHPLEGLLFGGAPAPDSLVPRARKAFPSATMIQGYGLTETNSIAVSASGEDYMARPKSTGRASPVNEIRVVKDGRAVDRGEVGEVWLRGPNVMKEYWRDPEATRKVITADGWLKTGDLGYLDADDFLYIKDRIKDIIIRGGENIDSVSVENALYADPRVHEAAAVGVPDERLGELVAAVVSVKPAYRASVTEGTLIASVRARLPRFAVPVMIVVHNQPFEHTPSGKIIKNDLRTLARRHWEARKRDSRGKEPCANL